MSIGLPNEDNLSAYKFALKLGDNAAQVACVSDRVAYAIMPCRSVAIYQNNLTGGISAVYLSAEELHSIACASRYELVENNQAPSS